ncbi:uncharacterized protein LOC144347826 [Saccoglossus kowalevskii]
MGCGSSTSTGTENNQTPTMDELIHSFRALDSDGSGSVTTGEIKKMLVQTKGYYTEDEVSAIMKDADVDENDRVSFSEYIRIIAKMFAATSA